VHSLEVRYTAIGAYHPNPDQEAIVLAQTVHLIFKTHLDVGFTDLAQNVVQRYFRQYIPRALDLARQMRAKGAAERFTWTTGSWLIYEYLEQASPLERARMEEGIAAGDIAWHALPFTTHTELEDPELFRFGLGLAQELDRRYGRQTIAAKMTDVPAHTRGIVPLLAEAGVQFLHIGVNPASTPPDVPPLFLWRDPCGAEIMVMYQKSYGAIATVPGLRDALAFAHTGDNLGPQSPEQIEHAFAELRAHFPGAEVLGSTLDAFGRALATVKDTLPVVTAEMGDTWIHGVGSDPQKVAQFRELLRLRQEWLAAGRISREDKAYRAFSRSLLMIPEHTWGVDIKTHLRDNTHLTAAQLAAVRRQPNMQFAEASWAEQRGYLQSAIAALGPTPLAAEARAALQRLEPAAPDLAAWERVADPAAVQETAHFRLRCDEHGALVRLRDVAARREWANERHPLAAFRYQALTAADYQRYYRQYVVNKRATASWSVPDFQRPGLPEGIAAVDLQPEVLGLYRQQDERSMRLLLDLSLCDRLRPALAPADADQVYGWPRRVTLEWEFPTAERAAYLTVQWFDKPATRVPEALWLTFAPIAPAPRGWTMNKLGKSISPLEVIRNGNRHLHAIGHGVSYDADPRHLQIDSLDVPLVAPGQRSLLDFNNRQPLMRLGMSFLLYSNIYSTNFPQWYDEDARFRFVLRF
jgi:hypothetical protein